MSVHLVVAFRSLDPRPAPERYLTALRSLSEQAAAMGGRLLSWGATVTAFEFDPDASVDAIELAISVALDSVPDVSFSVGISEGDLARTQDATAGVSLGWGPPLVRAVALCRSAKLGEVLVDPIVGAVKRGEVLTTGARSGLHGKERIRALLLDIKHPFRSALAESVGSLARPRFVGRSELGEMLVSAGSVAVVRADPGFGGSRFLLELARELEPARVLTLSSNPLGEPLGSLRRAMLRGLTLGHAPLAFSEEIGHSLDSLLAGEGLDLESAAELLATWLTPDSAHDPSGALLLDDAEFLDADTLEVIGAAIGIGADPFRVVARLRAHSPLPPALAMLPLGADVRLGALSASDAAAVADSCLRGEVDTRTAERWAARGAGYPLGIVESLYDALEGGDLVWESGVVTARLSRSNALSPASPKHWIKKRVAGLDADARLVVTALSVFGGEAEVRDVQELVQKRTDAPFEIGPSRAVLENAGWIFKVKPDMISLSSATHRDASVSGLEEEDFAAWHAAAGEVLRRRSRPLAVASAAAHYALAGDMATARGLAKQAAAAAQAVGLERAAQAFAGLATDGDLEFLVDRGLFVEQRELARRLTTLAPGPPPLDDDDDDGELPPDSLVMLDDEEAPLSEAEGVAPSEPPPESVVESVPPPPLLASVPPAQAALAAVPNAAPTSDEVLELADEEEPLDLEADDIEDLDDEVSEEKDAATSERPESGALVALRSGDADAVELVAEQLRVDPERSELAERLTAMANLARGETGQALRRLRRAAEKAAAAGSEDQCRTQLALAVGLARAQRLDEALLAALTALARARERNDDLGEQASVRFIAQLTEQAGHVDVAERWRSGAG